MIYQAGRINSHPSVILWGGNNENEQAFDWVPGLADNPKLYATDYTELFINTIRKVKHAGMLESLLAGGAIALCLMVFCRL